MDWAIIPLLVHFAGPFVNAVKSPTWGVLGVYFVATVAVCGMFYTATVTRRNGREANAITAAEKAWKRLDELRTT